jgi:hypothetical protein
VLRRPIADLAPAVNGDRPPTDSHSSGDGYGPPFERSPERERQDVILGLVDVDAAREQYCVALGPAPEYEADAEVTRALRAAARSNAISEDDR